jgi:ParB family transcriptional regulator, chromosome partitioning protein
MEGRVKEFGGDLASIFDDKNTIDSEDLNLIKSILLTKITPRKDQPRKSFNDESLNELAASIKAKGVIQPIIVRNAENGNFEIIIGERRWRAAQKAGLTSIPAIIKDYSKQDVMSVSLIENIQRENLNSVEEAMAINQLIEEFSMTHNSVAESIGKSRTTVTNLLRLLELQDAVKSMLKDGLLDMGHARALLSLDAQMQLMVAQRVIEKGMSVRDTEKMVQSIIKSPHHTQEFTPGKFDAKINDWTKALSKKIASNVKIHLNAKGEGKVTISVQSPEEIEWLIEAIKAD